MAVFGIRKVSSAPNISILITPASDITSKTTDKMYKMRNISDLPVDKIDKKSSLSGVKLDKPILPYSGI
jgi:hypothetical protein